ncbi:uncharacterized protein [Asterias amurensis]|uniref:uncharacterized protein n=1 Tax=Asterias amurensis TaxID=7602 RepID=UPI003AB64A06
MGSLSVSDLHSMTMRLRLWAGSNMETNNIAKGGLPTTFNHNWRSSDVAGVFNILNELDVFLEDQDEVTGQMEDKETVAVISNDGASVKPGDVLVKNNDVECSREVKPNPDEMWSTEYDKSYVKCSLDNDSGMGDETKQVHVDNTSFVTGACIECVDVDVDSALMNAVRNGHAPCLQCIINNFDKVSDLKEHLNFFREVTSNQGFPLLEAVERGHEGVVHLFLRFLKDCGCLNEVLRATDARGRMPVHLAAYHDRLGCLELVLACTPMEEAYWKDTQTLGTPLHHAAAGGAVRCLRRLLKVEDAEVLNQTGRTPVSLAAQAGSVGCLEELIDQAQVDPQRADHDGMTPVHYAALAGHLNCTHWLIRRARCSLSETRKKDGATAMHLAAGKGRCPILQWALNRELSFADELDVFGRTPVHYAAEEGHITALRTFSKFSRVHLDVKDFLGRTPSNLAERRGHSACIRFLDSCLQQRHPDGEGALLAKLTRSISSPGGLNKLNRRNSNRRSSRRKHISSVYLEEKSLTDTEAGHGRREPLATDGGATAGYRVSALVSQVGLMAIAPAVPEISFHRRIINTLFKKLRRQANIEEDFTVTM